MKASDVFQLSPVVPVIVVDNLEHAVPMAEALMRGGIRVLEVTLRTPVALEAIQLLREQLPDAVVGAGTVTTAEQLQQVINVGAQFAISPGITESLLRAGNKATIPLIPGIATVSELMQAVDSGYQHLKFFPAEAAGGVSMLKSIAGPFAHVRFCPTGGIGAHNYQSYLALANVDCVGGSWIVPADAVNAKDWQRVTELATAALSINPRRF